MTNQQPTKVAIIFVGPILYPATKNLRNLFSQLSSGGVKEVILQISSTGGSLSEGFALYHFLKSLPLNLTTHNIGSIESIANIVFLAGSRRLCCEHAHFMFHAFDWTYPNQQTLLHERLKEHSLSLAEDEARFVSILKRNSSVSDELLHELQIFNQATIIQSARAKEMGLVQEVQEACIPAGYTVWNVDY